MLRPTVTANSLKSEKRVVEAENDETSYEHADLFRQKVFTHFSSLGSKRKKTAAVLTANDISQKRNEINEILLKQPREPIRFAPYAKKKSLLKYETLLNMRKDPYLLARIRLKTFIQDKKVENFLLFLVFIDSIAVGITTQTNIHGFKILNSHAFHAFQVILSLIFVSEVILKIFIDLNSYWKSLWNILEFSLVIVTTLVSILDLVYKIFIPQIASNSSIYSFITLLRVFRVLRILKIISHFIELKIIMIALTKAVRSVVLIMILLIIFAYIYANIGVVLFSDMSQSEENIDTKFRDSFSKLGSALLSLFAVMTLDQWWKLFSEASKSNKDDFFSTLYFISWVILASFIFQNLFTGVMVNNFQQIRRDVEIAVRMQVLKKLQENNEFYFNETENKEQQQIDDEKKGEKTVNKAHSFNFGQNDSMSSDSVGVEFGNKNETHQRKLRNVKKLMQKYRTSNKEWKANMENVGEAFAEFKKSENSTWWPEDSLLYYYELIGFLMDNLKERMTLLEFANEALISMHDRDNLAELKETISNH